MPFFIMNICIVEYINVFWNPLSAQCKLMLKQNVRLLKLACDYYSLENYESDHLRCIYDYTSQREIQKCVISQILNHFFRVYQQIFTQIA